MSTLRERQDTPEGDVRVRLPTRDELVALLGAARVRELERDEAGAPVEPPPPFR